MAIRGYGDLNHVFPSNYNNHSECQRYSICNTYDYSYYSAYNMHESRVLLTALGNIHKQLHEIVRLIEIKAYSFHCILKILFLREIKLSWVRKESGLYVCCSTFLHKADLILWIKQRILLWLQTNCIKALSHFSGHRKRGYSVEINIRMIYRVVVAIVIRLFAFLEPIQEANWWNKKPLRHFNWTNSKETNHSEYSTQYNLIREVLSRFLVE